MTFERRLVARLRRGAATAAARIGSGSRTGDVTHVWAAQQKGRRRLRPHGPRIEELEPFCESLQGQIRLEGPMLAAALLVLEGSPRILLVIHHLVVDLVSWQVLLEDLERLGDLLSYGLEPFWCQDSTQEATAEAARPCKLVVTCGGVLQRASQLHKCQIDTPCQVCE